jgi:hypothetical protein
MKILSSASKIVFLVVTATVCVAYLFEIFMGKITLDSKDFFALALMVFTFYFSNKGETGTVTAKETTTTTESIPPFAGK